MSHAKVSALEMSEFKPSSQDLIFPPREYKTRPLLVQVPEEYFMNE
jgi:hypothetical protein